jgi:hypothetical protein
MERGKYATGYTVYEKDPVSGNLRAIQEYTHAQGFLWSLILMACHPAELYTL